VTSKPDFKVMVLLLVFMQLTRDLFAIAKFLFSIYINDLVEHCISGSDLYLYADDAKLFSFVTLYEDSFRLQNDIDCLTQWMEVWLLRLNIGKCKLRLMAEDLQYVRITMFQVLLLKK